MMKRIVRGVLPVMMLAMGSVAMAEPVKPVPAQTVTVGFGVEVPVHAVTTQTAGFGVTVVAKDGVVTSAGGRGFRGDNPATAQTVRGFGVIVDE